MKISFGIGGARRIFTEDRLEELGNQIALSIYDEIGDRVMGLSEDRLQRVKNTVELALFEEAKRINVAALQIIDRTRSPTLLTKVSPYIRDKMVTAFRASDLFKRSSLLEGPWGFPTGSVKWVALSRRWARRKKRETPKNANKFFAHKGSLVGTLKRPGYWENTIAHMGGFKVEVTGVGKFDQRKLTRSTPYFVLGHLTAHILPNIPELLMPMLASSRWMDNSEGGFEKWAFSRSVGQKLAGPPGRHRPLYQPLVHFWIVYRFPKVLKQTVVKVLKDYKR